MEYAEELKSLVWNQEFGLRCLISGGIAGSLYLFSAAVVHHFFKRSVDRDIFALTPYSDLMLGLYSVVFGSPWLQIFSVVAEKHPQFSKIYSSIDQYG